MLLDDSLRPQHTWTCVCKQVTKFIGAGLKMEPHVHHMIQERYLRVGAAYAGAIEIDAHFHLCLLRLPFHSCRSYCRTAIRQKGTLLAAGFPFHGRKL